MPNKKVSLEKMLDALSRVYSRWGGMSTSEMEEYEAIRSALIERKELKAKYDRLKKQVGKWKKKANEIYDYKEKWYSFQEDHKNYLREELVDSIRDFGEGKKKS